jgi:hypothetical protein
MLRDVEPEEMTPLEALNLLNQWKKLSVMTEKKEQTSINKELREKKKEKKEKSEEELSLFDLFSP